MLRHKTHGIKPCRTRVLMLSGKGLELSVSGSLGDVGWNRGVGDLQENPNNPHGLLSNPVWDICNFGFFAIHSPQIQSKIRFQSVETEFGLKSISSCSLCGVFYFLFPCSKSQFVYSEASSAQSTVLDISINWEMLLIVFFSKPSCTLCSGFSLAMSSACSAV